MKPAINPIFGSLNESRFSRVVIDVGKYFEIVTHILDNTR